jgi:hypothetical protein
MSTARHLRLVRILTISSFVWACSDGGVGAPCTPEVEYDVDFGGFAIGETYVESNSFQCETRLCLVNHFQGRVSCPRGQAGPEGGCRVPDGSASVATVVRGWDMDRPAHSAVYCSCRCDGPDPEAPYCACPDGFQCTELVPDVDVAPGQLAGSYCVQANARFAENDVGGPECTAASEEPICQLTQD